jgi:glycine cleavage system H protein
VAEIYTPVAGEVVEINDAVADDPELLNEDPHGKGWLIALRYDAADDLAALMDADAYQAYLEKGEG